MKYKFRFGQNINRPIHMGHPVILVSFMLTISYSESVYPITHTSSVSNLNIIESMNQFMRELLSYIPDR